MFGYYTLPCPFYLFFFHMETQLPVQHRPGEGIDDGKDIGMAPVPCDPDLLDVHLQYLQRCLRHHCPETHVLPLRAFVPGFEQLCGFHEPVDFLVVDDESEDKELKGHLAVAIVGIGVGLYFLYRFNDNIVGALPSAYRRVPEHRAGPSAAPPPCFWPVIILVAGDAQQLQHPVPFKSLADINRR
ncbi:hypothetical protein ADIS_4205 [Lunatimonas lonarensis]|uniref:Uncharacterized protein n=1 Tax=Lunatimonas lonarensis TaxID=1232681 RepID=R7ZMN1_9BACT|nr:hypothetical protein ADIS_4205 [Lunatimonas lonarensis]